MKQITVISFGYLHGDNPAATLTLDVRAILHDPHVDPAMRQKTGLAPDVHDHVMNTPGAHAILGDLHTLATTLLYAANFGGRRALVTVAIGCAGGRHRSVVLAAELADHLATGGWDVDLQHRHVARPVVDRPRTAPTGGTS